MAAQLSVPCLLRSISIAVGRADSILHNEWWPENGASAAAANKSNHMLTSALTLARRPECLSGAASQHSWNLQRESRMEGIIVTPAYLNS